MSQAIPNSGSGREEPPLDQSIHGFLNHLMIQWPELRHGLVFLYVTDDEDSPGEACVFKSVLKGNRIAAQNLIRLAARDLDAAEAAHFEQLYNLPEDDTTSDA